MAPALGAFVDDLDHGLLALQVRHVPTGRQQLFLILAGGGADDFAVDAQVDAGLARLISAADQKTDIAAFDGECSGGCRTLGLIAGLERVDQAAADKAGDRLLPAFGPVRRALPESIAGDRPIFIGFRFEVLEDRGHGGEVVHIGAEQGDGVEEVGACALGQRDATFGGDPRQQLSRLSGEGRHSCQPKQLRAWNFMAAGRADLHRSGGDRVGRLVHGHGHAAVFANHVVAIAAVSAEADALNAAGPAAADRVLEGREESHLGRRRAGVLGRELKQRTGDRRVGRVERDHGVHRFQLHLDGQGRIVEREPGDRIAALVVQRFHGLQRALALGLKHPRDRRPAAR